MHGHGPEGYGRHDLLVGIDYADALLEEGHTLEPFHFYDLAAFGRWARARLASLK